MSTREQILDAAARLLQEKGAAHATTKEIAGAVGVSEGALYKHFARKEEIFSIILHRRLPVFQAALDAYQPGAGSLQGNLEGIALALLSFYEQLLPVAVAFLSDFASLERMRATLQQSGGGPQRLVERVSAYLEEERRLRRIGPQASALTAATLLTGSCFQYIFLQQFLGIPPLQLTRQQFAHDIVQTALTGLAPD